MNFIKKNIFPILVILTILGISTLKLLKRKPKDQTQNASDILDDLGITTNQATINQDALDLAHHLGTAYPKWDPRSWTENDEQAFDILKNMSQSHFDLVAKLYHDVYAKGKTLLTDLARLLDDEYYSQLNFK